MQVDCEQPLDVMFNSAAMIFFDGNSVKIEPFQAPYINRPTVEGLDALAQLLRSGVARSSEWQDSAHRAEVVLRCSRAPLVQRQIAPRNQ